MLVQRPDRRAGSARNVARLPSRPCAPQAAVAANALVAGDVDALLTLSRAEQVSCDDVPAGLFPDCTPGRVLDGYGRAGADAEIRILQLADLRAELAGLLGGSSPGYQDDRGAGSMQILGLGTCGPPKPASRSYHLAFTTAIKPDSGGAAERWLGSLELVLRADSWVFALVFADSVAAWERVLDDPFEDVACGNVQPWPPG